MAKYWFARRFPPSDKPRSGVAPISTEGRFVVAGFVAAIVLGGLSFGLLSFNGQMAFGVALFVLLAIAGGAMFIGFAIGRGDHNHTAEDYRTGRVVNQ
jgi:hypothetical protein